MSNFMASITLLLRYMSIYSKVKQPTTLHKMLQHTKADTKMLRNTKSGGQKCYNTQKVDTKMLRNT